MSNQTSTDQNRRPIPAVKPETMTSVVSTTYSVAKSGVHRLYAAAECTVNVNSGGAWTLPPLSVEYVHFDPSDTVTVVGTLQVTECA